LLQGSLFIVAAGGGVAKFNNKMRLVGQNSNFYKMNNSKRNEVTVLKKASWLNIYNAEGVFKQILVGYMDGATDAYDAF
jgi:hypothetical protein